MRVNCLCEISKFELVMKTTDISTNMYGPPHNALSCQNIQIAEYEERDMIFHTTLTQSLYIIQFCIRRRQGLKSRSLPGLWRGIIREQMVSALTLRLPAHYSNQ